jgi:4a-hydroxytetrahydrobiopterin dehydratase
MGAGMPLRDRHARSGKLAKLGEAELASGLKELPGWRVNSGEKLTLSMKFRDFAELMVFVNRMAALAEAENHHPDFAVHYNQLELTLWTHDAGGLTENDLILAAKIDALVTHP